MLEKITDCQISSQAPEESGEGSTTNANGPERIMRQHERGAVKTCSKCKQERSEFHKNAVWCKSCVKEYDKAQYQKKREQILKGKAVYRSVNKEKLSELNKSWRIKNSEKVKSYLADYRKENSEKLRENKRQDYANNREAILAQKREYHSLNSKKIIERKRESRKNPERLAVHNHLGAKRRASQLQATPSWADLESIKVFYKRAQELTNMTGVKHSVDHIIPLSGGAVCGLHVANNLRVIPLSENCSKSNRVLAEDIV